MKFLDLINIVNEQSNLPQIEFDHKSLSIVNDYSSDPSLTETEFNFIIETVKNNNLKVGRSISNDWGLSFLAAGLGLKTVYYNTFIPNTWKFEEFFNNYFKTDIKCYTCVDVNDLPKSLDYLFISEPNPIYLDNIINNYGKLLSEKFIVFLHHSDQYSEEYKQKLSDACGYPLTPVFADSSSDHYNLAYISPLRI